MTNSASKEKPHHSGQQREEDRMEGNADKRMRYALGIDIGTTAVKVVLLSETGQIEEEASAAHDLRSPHRGWAEENAEEWWQNVCTCLCRIRDRAQEKLARTAAVGVSGMVPAIVLLDREGKPIRNTIQQNDARAVEEIEELKQKINQNWLYEKTGGFTNQQHVLPRLLWVKRHEPEVFERAATVLGSYDYIAGRLTGARFVELNWAAESGLFDIRKKEWIPGLSEGFGISASLFPEVKASEAEVGVTKGLFEQLGLRDGIPVIAGSADHVASTLSAGITEPGDLLIKFGGAGDILYCTKELKTDPRLFFDFHVCPGRYLLNGCMAASGSLVKWFVNGIAKDEDPEALRRLDQEAEKLAPASDGLIILPYFLGEKTPIFDPDARGVMLGLTLSHTKAHIFRAILEAVIYGFRHHIEVLEDMGLKPNHISATNGGSKSSFWCQIAADILGQEVRAFRHHPGSSLGVAFLAGKEAGLFQEFSDIERCLPESRIYRPDPERKGIYDRAYAIYRDTYQRLKPEFQNLRLLEEETNELVKKHSGN